MSKRRKFRDRRSASTTPQSVRAHGLSWRQRHAKRLAFNVENYKDSAIIWSAERGVLLTITNGNHHWKFERDGLIVEWWPSSAKCVIGKQWRNGIHTHDWTQLVVILNGKFPRKEA